MSQNILFGVGVFILIVQKINIFPINLYDDVFYCIAGYLPLFCFHQLLDWNFYLPMQKYNTTPDYSSYHHHGTMYPYFSHPWGIYIRLWAIPWFHQKENNQMAALLLAKEETTNLCKKKLKVNIFTLGETINYLRFPHSLHKYWVKTELILLNGDKMIWGEKIF